jgi:hypothetical protein
VDTGYAGPEFRYEYPPPITRSDPAETYAKVRVEKTRRKTDILLGFE